jgi:hypothetical protein
MATLSSSNSDAEVFASYDDNASYEEDSDRAKALAFITACRLIIRRLPIEFLLKGVTRKYSEASLRSEIHDAQKWRSDNPPSTFGAVTYADLRYTRE